MTLSKLTKLLAAVVTVGYVLTLVTSTYAVNTLKVGGALFAKIATGKDLVADILPPPAYLIEAYLEATLALDTEAAEKTSSGASAHLERLKTLQKDYGDRETFWHQQDLESNLKSALLTGAYEPGKEFWKIVDTTFAPALAANDVTTARSAYAQLTDAYQLHRTAIDKTVELANRENDRVVADAARQEAVIVPLTWAVGLFVLALILAETFGVLIAILKPMNRIKSVMNELATGRNDVVVPFIERVDEIGEMARAVDVFRANAIERERLEADAASAHAKEKQRQAHLDKQLLTFKGTITANVQVLVREVDLLRNTSGGLLKAAEQASKEADSSANSCASAAAGSQAVAAATEELNASVREIATQANHTSTIVGRTTEKARSTESDVTYLMESVNKIEAVVTLIREIANRTNLLALNATIESARAGEAGRGFAVVAAEVKNLSEQTAKATEEIADQIHAVQSRTEAAAAAFRDIGNQVAEIHNLTSSVAAAVEEQNAATTDIARNVSIVATGTDAAAASSRIVSEVAEHTGTEAEKLATASDQLSSISVAVSHAVQEFIDSISSDLTEQRASLREPLDTTVVVALGGQRHQARTINISRTGIKITGLQGARTGEPANIDIGGVTLPAKVVWANAAYCGLQFSRVLSNDELIRAGLKRTEIKELAA
jgi:methyl-accepting chemotaxis protein